jgi:hypothetical protein
MQNNVFQNRVVKTKKLGKDAQLQVSINEVAKRIFVDFSSTDGRLKIQKSFQDNFLGKKEAKEFEKKFKNLDEIKKYLRIK